MFLDTLDDRWPQSAQALLARRILPEYLRLGTAPFVANADVKLRVWRAGDQVLPVVYREGGGKGRTADVCSPWSHYVRYPLGEIDRHGRGLTAWLGRGVIFLGMPLLYISRIDEVVSVNNWLLFTNPQVALDREAVESLTAALCEQFPRRAILFRTVNPEIDPDLARNLTYSGYDLVASRTVYLFDPASRAYRKSSDARRDRRLLEDGKYQLVPHERLCAADMPRLAELHRFLYIEKHTPLNAEFSAQFFETAWRNRFLEFRALRAQGRIDMYVAFFELDGLLTASLTGYDVHQPRELGLFRRAFALLMEESRLRGLPMHLSAGAGAFKHHRGGRPCVEYDAVFDRHLPPHRRAGWKLLSAAGFLQARKVRAGW